MSINDDNDSIAQLDRAFDYESKGRRFESCQGHHLKMNSVTSVTEFFVFADKIYSSANRYSPAC